ncbi:FadR/GntR family transcriptional regulator [Myceligenerans crystallogenes]|uniref:FadR/GntR family transcriptional regulator n=1 Tax=Myceligenerans crystallogenes TaxID=316335 RepID=A0ABN2NM29_9MICO
MDTPMPTRHDDAPDGVLSQSEAVVHGIKRMLLSGELGPRSRLPVEKDLAARLGVSRGSLREGVRALVAMGILETRQGAGTYVTSLDARLLLAPVSFVVDLQSADGGRRLQHVRRVLEVEAAGAAAVRIDDAALRQADAVLRRFEEGAAAGGAGDHRRHIEIDVEFHRIIARASGNPVLEALIEALASRTVRGRMWRAMHEQGADERSHAEHRAILAAIARHDPDVARIRMGAHLLAVEEFLAADDLPDDLPADLPPGDLPPAGDSPAGDPVEPAP